MPAILTEVSKSYFDRLIQMQMHPKDAVRYGLILGIYESEFEETDDPVIFFRTEIDSLLWEILKTESSRANLSVGRLSGILIERFVNLNEMDVLCRCNLHR